MVLPLSLEAVMEVHYPLAFENPLVCTQLMVEVVVEVRLYRMTLFFLRQAVEGSHLLEACLGLMVMEAGHLQGLGVVGKRTGTLLEEEGRRNVTLLGEEGRRTLLGVEERRTLLEVEGRRTGTPLEVEESLFVCLMSLGVVVRVRNPVDVLQE